MTLVDLWAPWCGPCRMMGPILDEIAGEYAERGVRVVKVNSDEAGETAHRFDVRSIPTPSVPQKRRDSTDLRRIRVHRCRAHLTEPAVAHNVARPY